jgi:hypothetical protein
VTRGLVLHHFPPKNRADIVGEHPEAKEFLCGVSLISAIAVSKDIWRGLTRTARGASWMAFSRLSHR